MIQDGELFVAVNSRPQVLRDSQSVNAANAGDACWAAMVYLAISCCIPNTPMLKRAAIATGFSFVMELSQLYHSPWIDSLRQTRLGGLILGSNFLWIDLVRYSVGVLSCLACEATAVRLQSD